ncbi:MAG: hypothetical protein J6I84_02880 [Bacilli bacterium]|nr:hypothetical protein [Bacilli bacterium]
MGSLNKKIRREARHQRNIQKELDHKKAAWEAGKLIEENHNNNPYSAEYTSGLERRLIEIIGDIRTKSETYSDVKSRSDYVLFRFRAYRKKIQDFILHYNPELSKTEGYEQLKRLLEVYWDNPDDLWKEF